MFSVVFVSLGFLKDVTGSYMASFMVAGSFPIFGIMIMATLPHYFSCTDPPPPQRHQKKDIDKGSQLEMEQINTHTSPSTK